MSDSNLPPVLPLQSEFPRKVVLVFLLIVNTAIGIFFLFRYRTDTNLLVRHIFADMTIGMVAGFAVRILLRKRAWFIRFITATAALIVGLLLVGVLTKWRTGIGPLSLSRATIDWSSLIQISIGVTSMLLAMHAWSKPAQVRTATQPAGQTRPQPKTPNSGTRLRPKRKRSRPTQDKQPPTQITALPISAAPNIEPARSEIHDKPVIKRKRNAKTDIKTSPNLALRKPMVRLSKVENHLCPYCLEPVIRKDPRGIVECEICHTLHHGDCWSIAGSCQVPHFTA